MKDFIEFLKSEYPTSKHCEIEILYGYDSLQAPDGSMGFGVYIPDEKKIYVAGDIPEPERNIPYTIAHEYRHFMQDLINKPFDEDDAEKFADKVYKDYYREDGETGMRLIDADAFERKCMFDSDIEDMQDVIYALRDYPSFPAIPIPDNATNGDVLKRLLYGKAIITEFIHDVNISVNNKVIGQFDMEWWNSPYKRGETE